VGTWVIAEVYRLLVTQIRWLGGGSGVSINSAGQVERGTREAVVFWLALAVAVGSIVLVYLLLRSRRGLALTAIRDDETGARGLGVNVFRSKLWVYILAAFGTGVAGAVIYLNLLRVQPEAGFSLQWSALMIFAVVIGGLGTIEGPIIGAVIFFVLQQLLADYGTWYLILIGALAAGVVVFAQRGLWGTFVRRRAVDLFPVRRRLCLETVCFPEESPPPVNGASSPGDSGASSRRSLPRPRERERRGLTPSLDLLPATPDLFPAAPAGISFAALDNPAGAAPLLRREDVETITWAMRPSSTSTGDGSTRWNPVTGSPSSIPLPRK